MKRTSWLVALLGLFVMVAGIGCANGKVSGGAGVNGGGSSDNAGGNENQGTRVHVDVGAELEVNILVVKFKLWGVVKDADVLVVQAYDWTSRKVTYLLNGEEQTRTLTPEEAEDLRQAAEKAATK